jgi:hypothetical protein
MKLVACIALVVLVATAATARLKIDRDELVRVDDGELVRVDDAGRPTEVVRRVIFKCAMVRAHINCTVDTGVLD